MDLEFVETNWLECGFLCLTGSQMKLERRRRHWSIWASKLLLTDF